MVLITYKNILLFFVIVEFIFILSIYILIKVKFRGLKGL